jgi:hypothetical protein
VTLRIALFSCFPKSANPQGAAKNSMASPIDHAVKRR